MNAYILGTATYPPTPAEQGLRLEEMVYRTVRSALDDAGVSRQQLDHVTLGACDELDGRPISSMLMAGPAGSFLTDEIKVTDSGGTALCLGAARVMTGEFGLGVVASWCKPSKTDVETVTRMRGDPFFTRPLGLSQTVSDALFAQALGETLGVKEEEASRRAASAASRAARNPRACARAAPSVDDIHRSPYVATPLREGHCAPLTDGAAVLVLASEAFLRGAHELRPLARITGLGWATDAYHLGAERLRSMTSARQAWSQALARAGLASATDLDVIELDGPTAWHEAGYVRAFGIENDTSLSPSGGAFAQNPIFCTGLVGAVEAVLQVSGRAGANQVSSARRSAAHSCYGFAQQGNVVTCFESVEAWA